MELKLIPIKDLKFAEYNPRSISKENFNRLRASIKEFGIADPAIVNMHKGRELTVVGGHMRIRAADAEGMKDFPCFLVNLPEHKEKMLNIALNNPNLQGEYDREKLAEMLVTLDKEGHNIKATGFDEVQISNLLDEFMDVGKEEKEINTISKEPESKEGELYELGPHRLLCGDSIVQEDVDRLMNGKKADLVFTDPPYNVNYSGRGEDTNNGIMNDALSSTEFQLFSNAFFKNIFTFTKSGAAIYICSGWSSYPVFVDAMQKNNLPVHGAIIWVKENATMGWNDYRYKHEWIVKGKKGKESAKQATKSGMPIIYTWKPGEERKFFGGRDEVDVWELPRDSVQTYKHPTQKPDWLPMRAIMNSSVRGDILFDPFGGSGSTLIAAEKLGRICYTIEKDPRYCDVIRKRYESYTKPKTDA